MTEMHYFGVFIGIALLLGVNGDIDSKRWRPDWRCGPRNPLADGMPSECNPNEPSSGSTCCSDKGWCGNTPAHCACSDCIDYAPKTWRPDWRCGANSPYAWGKLSQCNPAPGVEGYCCSDKGWCGNTNDHCNCHDCVNYKCDCYEITNYHYYMAKIDYHLDRAETIMYDPVAAAKKRIDNRKGSSEETVSFRVSEAISETVSYTQTAGASISMGTSFSVGVPFIAKAKVSIDFTASYSYSSGKSVTKEKTIEATFTCNGAPGKETFCNAFLIKGSMFVPYTQTWVKKGHPQCTCNTDGVFKGVEAVELYMTVDELSDRIVARSTRKVSRSDAEGDVAAEKQEL